MKSLYNAANIVKRFFRNRQERLRSLKEQVILGTCSEEPILIGDENLYMYLKKEGETEIPLFNIFNFKPQSGIPNIDFLNEFHAALCQYEDPTFKNRSARLSHKHEFFIYKTTDEGRVNIHIIGKNKMSRLPSIITLFKSLNERYFETHFKKYLLYILANTKLNLDSLKESEMYDFNIENPYGNSDIEPFIHKDNTEYTCITYVDSPVTTELAFDNTEQDLAWIDCSPLFRFNSTKKLYTLCFNDKLMIHTIPTYEHEPISGFTDVVDSREIKIPKNRKDISRPENRKIIPCFINIVDREIIKRDDEFHTSWFTSDNSEDRIEFVVDFDELQNYKVELEEEQIQLTSDVITSIIKEPSLGKIPFTGGRKSRTRKTKKTRKNSKTKRKQK